MRANLCRGSRLSRPARLAPAQFSSDEIADANAAYPDVAAVWRVLELPQLQLSPKGLLLVIPRVTPSRLFALDGGFPLVVPLDCRPYRVGIPVQVIVVPYRRELLTGAKMSHKPCSSVFGAQGRVTMPLLSRRKPRTISASWNASPGWQIDSSCSNVLMRALSVSFNNRISAFADRY